MTKVVGKTPEPLTGIAQQLEGQVPAAQ
jgi:hypothetical protein